MISNNLIRLLVVVGVFLLLAVAKPFVIVRAGTVGVVYSFGSIVGQVDEGFHLIWPWWFITHTDIKVQRAVLDKLPSFSAETQDVFVRASLNYQVSPEGGSDFVPHRWTGLFSCADRAARSAKFQGRNG